MSGRGTTGGRYVFDLEATGLYLEADRIHCVVIKDLDTKEIFQYRPDQVRQGLAKLYYADYITGHNICGYDIPLIKKLYPRWDTKSTIRDTLVISYLLLPEQHRHGLEFYGKKFDRYKPGYDDWSVYTEEMLHRCTEDVEINHLTWSYLMDKVGTDGKWDEAIELEQEIATLHLHQTVAGVTIDTQNAEDLVSSIDKELTELDLNLALRLPKKVRQMYSVPINKPFLKSGGYSRGVINWFQVEEVL